MMTVDCFFRHEVAEKVRDDGIEQGVERERRATVMRILRWRDITGPDVVRDRVEACSDLDRLELWAHRSLHARRAEDLFAEAPAEPTVAARGVSG